MDFIIELIADVLLQFLLEVVFQSGFHVGARALSHRGIRVALGVIIGAGLGFGGGVWWGHRLTEMGRTDPPKSLWVSIGLLVAFTALGIAQAIRRAREEWMAVSAPPRPLDLVLPWRWSPARLFAFAAVNAAVALGIAVGFSPKPLG